MGTCLASIGARAPDRPHLVLVRIAVASVAVLALVATGPDRALAAPLPAGGTLDLLSEAGARLTGLAERDLAGWSVAAAGDVNGDGLDDVIVGAPATDREGEGDRGTNDPLIEGAGAAYVVFGALPATPTDLGALGTGALPGFSIEGAAEADDAGRSVAGAGDVNGDGLDDVIVGAPGVEREVDRDAVVTGAAYIVFGKTSLDAVDLAAVGTPGDSQGMRILGGTASGNAGYSVSAAGDVDGDGTDDVIVGAPGADRDDDRGRGADRSVIPEAGAAYVVFTGGTPATVHLDGLGAGGFRIDGAAGYDEAGRSVARIGDLNGDGRSEVIVGAPFAGPPPGEGGGPGAAYVVFGKASGAVVDLSGLDGEPIDAGYRIDGAVPEDELGSAVARVGDLNGDGLPEAVVGAPAVGSARGGEPAAPGAAYVVFGKQSTGTVNVVDLDGEPADGGYRIDGVGRAGYSVASGGDLNGDGSDDVLLGAPWTGHNERPTSGSAYGVFGKSGTSPIDATALAPDSFRFDGAAAGDQAGWSLAGAGDVNGDGGPDLIVGAPYAHAGGASPRGDGEGAAYVVYGPAPQPGPGLPPQPGPPAPAPLQSAVTAAAECTASLRRPLASVTHWAVIRGGLRARLKVAPGGYVIRPDREARFIVQVRRANRKARSRLRHVAFRLDGRRLTTDRRPPYTAAIGPRTLSAGSHLLTATAYPSRGGQRTLRLRFQASDCEAAAFSASMISKVPRSLADLELRVQSGGPELGSVSFKLPRALRIRTAGLDGKRVGTVQLVGTTGATTRKALAVGRRRGGAVDLLETGGLNVRLARRSGGEALEVTGLEGLRATGVRVVLNGRRTGMLRNPPRCARHRFSATLTSANGERIALRRSLAMCKGRLRR